MRDLLSVACTPLSVYRFSNSSFMLFELSTYQRSEKYCPRTVFFSLFFFLSLIRNDEYKNRIHETDNENNLSLNSQSSEVNNKMMC